MLRFFGVNGFGGVLNAFPIPRMKRSSAPGSSSISVFFLGGLTMSEDDPGKIFSDWPNADMFGVSAAHLHALGAISLTFNKLESAMSLVFTDYLKSSMEIGQAVFHRLNNNQRIDILRQLIDESPDETADCVRHAILCFEICCENRNTLAHIVQEQFTTHDEEFLHGRKKNSQKTQDLFFVLGLAELRRVADEILATYEFVIGISYYKFREWHELNYPGKPINSLAGLLPRGLNTLPDKPPRPNKLNPLQLR